MMCKIFVPVTGSNESKQAIDKAVEMAAVLNAKISAINVLDKDSLAKLQRYKIFIEEESAMFGDSLRRDAEKYLDYARNIANSYHVEIETVSLEGEPFTEIYQHVQNDASSQKFVMIAGVKDAHSFIETYGAIEKKLLRSGLSIIIAGDK